MFADCEEREHISIDQSHQEQAGALFAISVVAPTIIALGQHIRWLRKSRGGVSLHERDNFSEYFRSQPRKRGLQGDLVYRPFSYTPWPVEKDVGGEGLRIEIGPISDLKKTTFVFDS